GLLPARRARDLARGQDAAAGGVDELGVVRADHPAVAGVAQREALELDGARPGTEGGMLLPGVVVVAPQRGDGAQGALDILALYEVGVHGVEVVAREERAGAIPTLVAAAAEVDERPRRAEHVVQRIPGPDEDPLVEVVV